MLTHASFKACKALIQGYEQALSCTWGLVFLLTNPTTTSVNRQIQECVKHSNTATSVFHVGRVGPSGIHLADCRMSSLVKDKI